MNITLLANRDIASAFALAHLLPQLSEHTVSIFLSARVGKKNADAPQALQALSAFDSSLLDNTANTRFNFQTIETLINKPIVLLPSIKTPEGFSQLQNAEADLFISIRFGHILHDAAIALPRLGVINLHSGVLPDYKGVMASFWAMNRAEATIGSTLHFIDDDKIDCGAILDIRKRPVNYQKSYLWNVLHLYPEGCRSILDAVKRLDKSENLKELPQAETGNYFTFPTEVDIKHFHQQGYVLFKEQEIHAVLCGD